MLRSEDSCLRYIAVNDLYFTVCRISDFTSSDYLTFLRIQGKWVLDENNEDSNSNGGTEEKTAK